MQATPAPSARPEPRPRAREQAHDAFDRLLETSPVGTATGAAPVSSRPEHPLPHEAEAPSLREFIDGFALYRDPIACAVLAGAGLAALGVFVVLRRAVFVTATLSTAAGLGVVLAFYLEIHHGLGLPPVAGALAASLACTWLVGTRSPSRLPRETWIAVVYVVASASIVLFGARVAQEAHDVASILFGTAVLVRPVDVLLVLGGTLAGFALLAVTGRSLAFIAFDRDGARVQGLPVEGLETAFWFVFALEVSVATRALGALPVFAFSVLPAAAGLAAARRVPAAVLLALVVGALSGGLGYVAAFVWELPVGAAEAATCAVLSGVGYLALRATRT